jgi:hypothetical protein
LKRALADRARSNISVFNKARSGLRVPSILGVCNFQRDLAFKPIMLAAAAFFVLHMFRMELKAFNGHCGYF